MSRGAARWIEPCLRAGAVVLALGFTALVLVFAGAPPLETFRQILEGSFGSVQEFSYVLRGWVPLVLVSAGLLVTFAAGLWNIGIEGQVMLGAISATWALRLLQNTNLPPPLVIVLAILAGVAGGAAWAALAGGLKTFGGVHEIFGGLGLNFVATAVTLWLIFGPWKRPGTGSMSGTEPFPEAYWMPDIPGWRVGGWSLAMAVAAMAIVFLLLRGTYFGLKLNAVGRNARAAFRLGVPTWQYMLLSFALCGALAGLAGALQVTAVYHRLIPSISSGYGFLGLLVVMLAAYRAPWAAVVALFFAAINIGSIQLPIVLRLDSSLSGVLQGVLVLCVLMAEGARQRWMRKS